MKKLSVNNNAVVINSFEDYANMQDSNTLCIQKNMNELISKSNGHGFIIFLLTAAVTGLGYYTHSIATKLDRLTEDYRDHILDHSESKEIDDPFDFEEDLD